MKISFIIPAFNEENYVGRCIRSIRNEAKNCKSQLEIIVVNNASTDNTTKVAESFTGVMVINEPRKGITFARQAGFHKATGDLIAHLDADSQLTPGWIATVEKTFLKNSNLIALSGPVIFNDLPLATNVFVRLFYSVGYVMYLVSRFALRISSMIQGSNVVIKKSALERIGGYNTNFEFYGEDTELAKRLSKVGSVIFTLRLPVYTSGRRITKEGLLTMGIKYQMNYLWTLFFQKPYTPTHTDIRTEPQKLEQTNVQNLKKTLLVTKTILSGIMVVGLFGIARSSTGTMFVAKVEAKQRLYVHNHFHSSIGHVYTTAKTRLIKFDFDQEREK